MPEITTAGFFCEGCETFDCTDPMSFCSIDRCTDEQAEMWLKNHKLMYQAVVCLRGHQESMCKLIGKQWICPVRACRARIAAIGPLLDGKRQRTNGNVSMNSILKGQLKRRGGRMGNGVKQRDARLKFIAEVCNGVLKRGASEGNVMRRICQDIAMSCKCLHLTPPEEVTDEQQEGENEDEDGVPSEAESGDYAFVRSIRG